MSMINKKNTKTLWILAIVLATLPALAMARDTPEGGLR